MMLYLIAALYLLVLATASTTISSGGAAVIGPWLLVISLQNVPLIFTIRTITGRQIERAWNLGLM